MTDYRHEWKIELSPSDLLILRQRLRRVLQPDAHAVDGRYLIRSLYFDTPEDRALREKLDGVSRREKFRIRYYNGDAGVHPAGEEVASRGGLGLEGAWPQLDGRGRRGTIADGSALTRIGPESGMRCS